jgi:hypothetical protein
MSKRIVLNRRKHKIEDGSHIFLKVGDFVFLSGETVIHKIECTEQTSTGFRFKDLHTGEKFLYRTPVPYFKTGHPLFKNGLPAYEGNHAGMEIRWIKAIITQDGQEKIAALIKLHRELGKKSEVEIFFINVILQIAADAIKHLDFNKIKNGPEFWYRDALGRIFTVWRKAIPDFGGVIGAMDGVGLFVKDFLELNVERALRGGLPPEKLYTIKRTVQRGITRALQAPRKG